MGPQHAYGLAARLEQVAEPSLTLNQGTLYPALVRLEQKGWIKGSWQRTEHNREAKYYAITKSGLDSSRRLRAGVGSRRSLTSSSSTKASHGPASTLPVAAAQRVASIR